MLDFRFSIAAVAFFTSADALLGQGTYKLEVKTQLKPAAALTFEGTKIQRSALKDDPGFRLQYTFKKDGKPLKSLEARGAESVDLPDQSPGTYSVTLELFHPSYKSGSVQKGQFRQASNELIYELKAPAKAGGPAQVKLIGNKPLIDTSRVLGKPAVVLQCGKGGGKEEKELLAPGYEFQLLQGTRHDGWGPPAGKSHAWLDKDKVHFVLKVPVGVAGVLRLHSVDGEGTNFRFRMQKLLVEGKEIATQAVFHGAGVVEVIDISAKDTQDGKIDVVFQNALRPLTAVVSVVEFFPQEKR